MKKTTILILVLMLGSVTLASAGDFSTETKDVKPAYCAGAFGLFAPLFGASCGPDWGGGDSTLSGEEKKVDAPESDTTETKLVRRVGGR